MRLIPNYIKTIFSLCLVTSFYTFANDTQEATHHSEIAATHSSEIKTTPTSYQPQNKWMPYFNWVGDFQKKEAVFSEVNIGIGFLYYIDVQGNLGNQPPFLFSMIGSTPDKRDLSYSKTPLFEYIVGYRFSNWFKTAISYQNQSNIYVQTRSLLSTNGTDPTARIQFNSDLQLNSLMAKFYFELPWPMVVKTMAFSLYGAGATGVSWQSWSNITDRIFQTQSPALPGPDFVSADVPYRQKTIANVGAMADAGFRVHSAYPNSNFSMTAGCKYNYWGQTRNLGKFDQQGNFKRGLTKPFKIKTLYSFAPYIGLHWNFPVTKGYMINGQSTQTDEMFFSSPKMVYKQPCVTAQVNIGPSFLYFSKLRGNLACQPQELFFGSGTSIPLDRRLSYTKSPLLECLLGYRVSRWLELGISYLYQNETMILSRWLPGRGPQVFDSSLNQFKSYLNLNAFMAKLSCDLITGVIQNMALTPFISAGVGPSWQSWTDIKIERTSVLSGAYRNNFLYLRDTIVANASWMADAGLKIRNANPDFLFSLVAGCRYNQWGQVRNIGNVENQNGLSMGLVKPIKAKILYSFSPYLGMQWDFPVCYNYKINSKVTTTWAPYITNVKNLQKRFSLMTQVNIGPGILIFDKIRGNLGGVPSVNFTQHGESPFAGHLRYNITPVYEFVLGYRFLQWFKSAIAYQTQKSIFVSTAPLTGADARTFGGAPLRGVKNQLRSHLTLDSFMLKFYFELPYPLIFKGYAISPYIAGGNGVSWQSWTNTVVNRLINAENSVGLSSMNQSIRQKIIANYAWMAEGGFRVFNASPNFPFSGVFGCKYIQWGQTRNIGKLDQQANNMRLGLLRPFKIKVLGSITPFVGLQWNF
ncbi:MAG: hypothetical protein S4CHLAM6_11560 [Chlamydiae bacterium]|nr:hypothetical protein [Chlamydiota bacterium]